MSQLPWYDTFCDARLGDLCEVWAADCGDRDRRRARTRAREQGWRPYWTESPDGPYEKRRGDICPGCHTVILSRSA